MFVTAQSNKIGITHRQFLTRTRPLRTLPPNHRYHRINASSDPNKKQLIDQIEKSLKDSGVDRKTAQSILKNWSEQVGHTVTSDDLRKILVGQSQKAIVLVLFSTLLDAGAAYGSFVAGNYLGFASSEYGWPAVVGQAIAYLLAGYYVAGAFFDFFKLGAVAIAAFSFNVDAAAFLTAVEDIAGQETGLEVADRYLEAANSVKVLSALNTMADLLKEQSKTKDESSGNMLADLGAYLTLEKAQRVYGFDSSQYGLTDSEAATIATIFAKYDTNDDGVLSEDEFKRLCSQYTTDLTTDDEFKAALKLIDTNKDGTIEFDEFVRFWQKQINN